jgi:hypothetical protein
MKIIITEDQHNKLKDNLMKLINRSEFSVGVKAVGGLKNLIKILYDGDYGLFFNDVLDNLISNTHKRGHHYYLFDCNISVFLDHSSRHKKPVFNFSPNCFDSVMKGKYGVDNKYISNSLWERYSNYVIDRYLKEK